MPGQTTPVFRLKPDCAISERFKRTYAWNANATFLLTNLSGKEYFSLTVLMIPSEFNCIPKRFIFGIPMLPTVSHTPMHLTGTFSARQSSALIVDISGLLVKGELSLC